jgi:hypothetical protein
MVVDEPGKHISFEDEHFHPTITQTDKGEIYLVAGKEHSSIFRVDGFNTVKRRTFNSITLDAATLAKLPETSTKLARKQSSERLKVQMGGTEPVVDGKVGEYAFWAPIEGGPKASARIGAKHLYAAWQTGNPEALLNGGGDYKFLFKRGGSVDIMLETSPPEYRKDSNPIAGDLRLLVTKVKGQTRAILYKPVVPGTAQKDRLLFDSPVGAVYFDAVVDVSEHVKLAQVGGDVEISIPLNVLGFKPNLGQEFRADMGVLRGDGAQTIQRLYWNNTDTVIVSDVPSEARLMPANWGIWKIEADGQMNDGSFALSPQNAKLLGDNIRLKKSGDGEDAEYSVGFWDNPKASLQWQMTVPKAGKYRVDLTYGNGNDTNDFIFSAGDQKLTGKTAKTGGWDNWKTMNLGEVALSAGESTFTLSPDATLTGGLMDFKLLRLVPVK